MKTTQNGTTDNIRRTKHSIFTRAISLFLSLILIITSLPLTAVFGNDLPSSPANTRFSIYNNDPAVGIGEGINAVTGNFSRGYIDLSLPMGEGLRLTRAYNVSNHEETALGIGWRHNFMFSLERVNNDINLANNTLYENNSHNEYPDSNTHDVLITMNDGTRLLFTRNTDGTFSSPSNADFTLAEDFSWLSDYELNATNHISFDIETISETIISPSTSTPPALQVTYGETFTNGEIFTNSTSITDATFTTTTPPALLVDAPEYPYPLYPFSPILPGYTLTSPCGLTYRFNPYGELTEIIDRQGRITTLTHENNQLISVQNTAGQLFFFYEEIDSNSAGSPNTQTPRLIRVTDSTGRSVLYNFNSLGLLSSFTDISGRTEYYFYTNGLLTEIRNFAGTTILRNEYDHLNRVIRQTSQGGFSISITYDSANRTNQVTDNRGRVTTYIYTTY